LLLLLFVLVLLVLVGSCCSWRNSETWWHGRPLVWETLLLWNGQKKASKPLPSLYKPNIYQYIPIFHKWVSNLETKPDIQSIQPGFFCFTETVLSPTSPGSKPSWLETLGPPHGHHGSTCLD
jgi:hypothetical protein